MKLQDVISSSLRKDMKELKQFQERLKEIKEECNTNIQRFKRNVENINPGSIPWNKKVFHVLFGKEFNNFREGFVRVMDRLEIQLDKEEVHECHSKKCLTELKKQFEKFLADTSNCKNKERTFQKILNKKHYVLNTQGFKDLIIRCLNGIKKGIDARVSHEEVLRVKETDVNKRRKKERHLIEFEMPRRENATIQGMLKERNNRKEAIAERWLYKRAHDNRVHERTMQTREGMIKKDASEIDNNVAGASHDRDNITENKRKMGLGYTDPCPLDQAIACHPKLYDAQVLGLHYVKPNVHDTKEILNDAEDSQVKMNEKQFQFNYQNMNSLYDTFVPQTKLSLEQYYFSDPSTSNVSSASSKEMLDLPIPKMPNEGKLLKLFEKIDNANWALRERIDKTLLKDTQRRWISDNQNELREFYKTDVIPMSVSLSKSSKELQQELTEEVQEMLNIFESMEGKVDRTSKKNEILQNKIDQILEENIANDINNLVMQSYMEIKKKEEIERFSKESKDGDKF
nr:hypothetical protein [Tanacetum cinerariifolium]